MNEPKVYNKPNSRIPAEIAMPSVIWHNVIDELPDDETTVLVYSPNDDEPVWVGYRDAGTWWNAMSLPQHGSLLGTVTHWAHLPEGPK